MQQQVKWTEPVLCHHQHNMAKNWFVYFDFTDLLTGKTVRKQYRNGINYIKRKDERIKQGNALKLYLKKKLESGWNPLHKQDRAPADIPPTVRAAFALIMDLKRSSLKKKSMDNYRDITNLYLKWCAKYGYDTLPLNRFGHKIAQAYMDYLLIERRFSGKTHNGNLAILKAFWNVICKRWKEVVKENPFADIAELPESTGRNIAYTEEEAKALMQWYRIRDIRVFYAASIMFHCYIRKTELSELRVGDINWEARSIIINSDSAKNRSQESATIPEGLLPILEEMNLKSYPPDYYIFGRSMQTSKQKICKPDVISDKHLTALRDITRYNDYKGPKSYRLLADQFRYEHEDAFNTIAKISAEKTFYSWKHTGVVMYWHIVKDIYYMMRQLRHREMQTTMIYMKSLGLMPNDAFRNASISIG